jgi:alkyl hydroperoxide reductase subunit F
MYDVLIIGAGPAGLTASIYCARKKLKTLILSKDIGGQAAISSEVDNYLGYHLISGAELVQKFEEHIKEFDIKLELGVEVKDIRKIEGGFEVATDGQDYQGRAMIIASGKIPRRLDVPGERKFLGRGVTYCATCDAPLFAKRDVAVVGGGNSALDATLQLTKIANKIYLISRSSVLKGDEVMREKALASSKVEILYNTEVKNISGKTLVEKIEVLDKESGKTKELEVQGVFIEIGSIPSIDFAKGLIEVNERNEIKVDSKNSTNIPGIFAAGDVTDVLEKQIIIAAGEGAKAALSTYGYLAKLKEV